MNTTTPEIRFLVMQALSYLGGPQEEAAVWRLIDAAGFLSIRYPTAIGVKSPTGLGFQITRH